MNSAGVTVLINESREGGPRPVIAIHGRLGNPSLWQRSLRTATLDSSVTPVGTLVMILAKRYLPGLFAITAAILLFTCAPKQWRVQSLILATAVALCAMEAEYWIAHGFPQSELPFFVIAQAVTLIALLGGSVGGFVLGVNGLAFFSYVNTRFYAPYLLDYVLPAIYTCLIIVARQNLNWRGKGVLAIGFPEVTWWCIETVVAIYKTSILHKWAWITGKSW
jgi:hypothetical protein